MKTATLIFTALVWTLTSENAQAQTKTSSALVQFEQNTAVIDLDPMGFKKRIEQGDVMLIDVRTPAEYVSGHIAGSTNIDWTGADYEKAFGGLDPAKPLLLYCAGGGRSDQAREYLAGKGYKVAHLAEGIAAWKKAGLPVVKD